QAPLRLGRRGPDDAQGDRRADRPDPRARPPDRARGPRQAAGLDDGRGVAHLARARDVMRFGIHAALTIALTFLCPFAFGVGAIALSLMLMDRGRLGPV